MSHSSAEAFEDGIDLQIGLLEAAIPSGLTSWDGYPFPRLALTAEQEMRTFRTIILENPYLRATILPGLGGRIISLFDKRTGVEILRRHPMIEPQAGGKRGAYVREGIQVCLDGAERLNSLGNVATQFEPPSEDEEEAAVWIAETFTGTGLSFHLRISLPADRAELRLEARVFNRWFRPQPYNGGLSLYLGEGTFDGSAFYSQERNAGVALFPDGQPFDGATIDGDVLYFSRFAELRELAPRQVDTWTLSLIPISGLADCLGASTVAAASLSDGVLRIQVSEQRLNHKLLMLTEENQTLEAIVDLYPENVFEIPLEGLKPIEFVLRDPAKQEILRVSGSPVAYQTSLASAWTPISSVLGVDSSRETLLRATFDISTRHIAHTLLGMKSLAEKDSALAGSSFEQALNYNAEDPLLWWGKAVAARLDEQDNQAELLNAHFLAPLEPALRSESFLSQPINLDPEPNRLLAPLEENPEEFIEVACLLIEAGLFDQASRWIDEALRHRDLPMLRYLMAYCLIAATRLSAEASDHIRIAAATPLAPPFPFRDVERVAIETLFKTFPDDKHLTVLVGFVSKDTSQLE